LSTARKGREEEVVRTGQHAPDGGSVGQVAPAVRPEAVEPEPRGHPLLKGTPIVFLTAIVADQETRGHEAKTGKWNYLAKPVTLDELVKCIERHLPE
jgi:CheY-like chemotaxis protein